MGNEPPRQRRIVRPAIFLLILAGLSGSGTWLVSRESTYQIRRPALALDKGLVALRTALLDYRQTHGRFPTNDEGLAALDNFDERGDFPLWFGRHNEYMFFRPMLRKSDSHCWLREAIALAATSGPDEYQPPTTRRAESAVIVSARRKGIWFPVGPGGVYSSSLMPYIYENRKGLPVSAFAASPANEDSPGEYSLKVDDGIFVYSVSDKVRSDQAWAEYWRVNQPRIIGLALLLASGVMVLTQVRSMRRLLGSALFAFLILAGVCQRTFVTCYIMSVSGTAEFRSSNALAVQRDLLDKYRAAGVLGEAAYQKAVEGLDLDKALVPTTRPESSK